MSNIITPDTQEKQQEGDSVEAAAELTHNEVQRIAGALADLHELEDQKIITPTTEARKRGLREYLSNSFIKFGPQFLGAWFSLKGEYEPLIGVLAMVFKRVDGNVKYMQFQEAAARQRQLKAEADATAAAHAAAVAPTPSPEAQAVREQVEGKV